MGRYINQNSKGIPLPARGKAKALLEDGAIAVAPEFRDDLVCVVMNGLFDAAAYCYSQEEFKEFSRPEDCRPKLWFIYPFAKTLAK